MFIDVKLISGFSKPLTYKVPENLRPLFLGSLVTVPLRAQKVIGLVIKIYSEKPTTLFELKDIFSIEKYPTDPLYFTFLKKLSWYYALDEVHFIKRIKSFLKEKESQLIIQTQKSDTCSFKNIQLTEEQETIVKALKPDIITQKYSPTILHGVTGSGKTEIYKQLIYCAWINKKTSLLLLPEVSLAIQFERILRSQLPADLPLFSFHSATPTKLKQLAWNSILENRPCLIIGVHLPILFPFYNLGIIIIDEEHETGFQEKKHPKINTKQAALLRAQHYNIPILLGSATPSLSSLYNVEHKNWNFFQLKKRFAGSFPEIELVLLTDKKERKNFWISDKLFQEITDCLAHKKQALIFLNRRGVCFFIQCKSCSFIFRCKFCSVSLTLHEDKSLYCHYCSYNQTYPSYCTECKAAEFFKKGIGTEQIMTILKKLFPYARIARADLDSTSNKKQWAETVNSFEKKDIDILVGTQTITKGYHFPHVTLVGIIWADINLNFPFYNAQESTLQQLIQVAGRAGRENKESKVIVQSMGPHRIFSYLNEIDYLKFYQEELIFRKTAYYPPFIRFSEIELKHKNEEIVEKDSFFIACKLIKNPNLSVLGPTKPLVSQIKKIHSRKIYIKTKNLESLHASLKDLPKSIKSNFYFTPDPLN